MSNAELKTQFERCKTWRDPDQWDLLGLAYYQRGYELNAAYCFKQADLLRAPVAAETMIVRTDLGFPGGDVALTLVPVAPR